MRNFAVLLLFSILFASAFFSCRKDQLDTDSSAKLLFSNDTIVFDTVFTTIGSATRNFKIYNTSSKSVKISSIRMAGGSASFFHMNVDGSPVVSTGDLILKGGDSMYVFVDVTIDPNNSNNPLMVEDSILFETNGNRQKVILDAVGQDAYFHYYETLNCNEVWNNDKPHVIWGYAIVPSCCALTINAGARVHLHHNAVLAVDSCASLHILGSNANPVTIQGDRLEHDYAEEPGQYFGIWLSGGSKDNIIDWVLIKNGSVGVLCDTLGPSANPTLTITNTKIRNMTFGGIVTRAGSWVEGDNLAITNCGQYCAAILYGGKCKFRHCTFANYWNIDTRTIPAVVINNWYKIDDFTNEYRDLTAAEFDNCIIYGDLDNEFLADSMQVATHQFNFIVSHCLVKTNNNVSNTAFWLQNVYNQDPKFHDVSNYDLHIYSDSPARNIGDPVIGTQVPFDLDNVLRTADGQPDAGAYEFQ